MSLSQLGEPTAINVGTLRIWDQHALRYRNSGVALQVVVALPKAFFKPSITRARTNSVTAKAADLGWIVGGPEVTAAPALEPTATL